MVAPAPVNGSTTSEAVSGGIDHYELGFGDLPAWQTTEVAWSAARDKVREDLLEAGIGAQSSCSLRFINVPAGTLTVDLLPHANVVLGGQTVAEDVIKCRRRSVG